MWTRLAIACAALASATLVRGDEYFTGDMTAYTLGQPSAGNCNFMNAPSDAAVNYAALNAPQWASTKNCGRCALVSCADSRCADQSKTQLVYILDQCPECKTGDLDVAPSVFKTLTGSDPSRYTIKWKFVDCPVTGNIKYCLKGGSNAFWTAIQPTNTVTGVQSMQINSQATTMVTSAYYYLLNGQSTTQTDLSSVKVTLTSVSGEVVTDTVSLTAGSCADGAHQFSRGTAPSPAAPVPAPAPTSAPTPAPAPVTPTPTTQTPVAQTTTAPTTVAPVTTQPVQQSTSDNSTVGAEAGVPETGSSSDTEKPGTVKAGDANSSISSREAEERTTTGTEESGLLDAIDSTSTPSSDSTTSDKNAAGSSGTADASTRLGATESTSPAVIVLSVMGGIGVVALAVLAVVVKRKRMMDKEDAERDDSMMVVNLRSFDTPDNARNRLDVSTL